MTTFYAKAEAVLIGDTGVEVRRSFRAPAALVWRAHTEPALFRRWMLGPPGYVISACEMDVRPGGAYRITWTSAAAPHPMAVFGDYREVQPHRRLVTTEYYDTGEPGGPLGDGSLQVLEFSERDGVTTLVQRNDFATTAARDAAVAGGMCDGIEPCFAALEAALAAGIA
ncbi:MAG: SRPBCC domain-containing protein [Alphaproteobacteria bacterium]|nr:SRPBCC domain-containing protein [Alphaproteobacteria bacterium]